MSRIAPVPEFDADDFQRETLSKRRSAKLEDLEENDDWRNRRPSEYHRQSEYRASSQTSEKPDNETEQFKNYSLKDELLGCIGDWATSTTCNFNTLFNDCFNNSSSAFFV
jgi:hypothetical protein